MSALCKIEDELTENYKVSFYIILSGFIPGNNLEHNIVICFVKALNYVQ